MGDAAAFVHRTSDRAWSDAEAVHQRLAEVRVSEVVDALGGLVQASQGSAVLDQVKRHAGEFERLMQPFADRGRRLPSDTYRDALDGVLQDALHELEEQQLRDASEGWA